MNSAPVDKLVQEPPVTLVGVVRVGDVPIAPDVVADFGPGGVFSMLDRAGLALIDV